MNSPCMDNYETGCSSSIGTQLKLLKMKNIVKSF